MFMGKYYSHKHSLNRERGRYIHLLSISLKRALRHQKIISPKNHSGNEFLNIVFEQTCLAPLITLECPRKK